MAAGAHRLPTGKVFVPLLTDDRVSAENIRDLKRTLEGGGVYVVNRHQRFPIGSCCKVQGDMSREACEKTFQELASAIDEEMMAEMDPKVLRQLTLRVASHVSVGPGLQAVLAHSLPPALWQPTFTVCVGYGQVRVLTLAYVGQPLAGDRPSCKQSGTVLRILTGNLSQSGGLSAASARYRVFPAAHGAESIEEHLEALEPLLLAACTSGDWAALEKKNPPGAERSRSYCGGDERARAGRLGSVPRRMQSAAAAGAGAVARAASVSRALRQAVETGTAEELLPVLAGGRLAEEGEEGEEAAWESGPQAGARLVKEQLGAGVSLLRGLFAGGQPTGAPRPGVAAARGAARSAPAGPPRKVGSHAGRQQVDRRARMQAAMQAKATQPAPPPAVASDQSAAVANAKQPAAHAVASDPGAEEAKDRQCAAPAVGSDTGAEEAKTMQPASPAAAFDRCAGEAEAAQAPPLVTSDSSAADAGDREVASDPRAVEAEAAQLVPAAVASDQCATSEAASPAPLAAPASDEAAADAESPLPPASPAVASDQGTEKAAAVEPASPQAAAASDQGVLGAEAAQPASPAVVSGDRGAAEAVAVAVAAEAVAEMAAAAAAAVASDHVSAEALASELAPPAAVASGQLAAESKVTTLLTSAATSDPRVALPGAGA